MYEGLYETIMKWDFSETLRQISDHATNDWSLGLCLK